jgi:hypothetical protein
MKKRIFLLLLTAILAAGTVFAQQEAENAEEDGAASAQPEMNNSAALQEVKDAKVASAASTQPEMKFSAGVGGSFGGVFNGDFSFVNRGVFAFFDIIYTELSLGFFSYEDNFVRVATRGSSNIDLSRLDIGLLGKYPIVIDHPTFSHYFTFFPIFGVEYTIFHIIGGEIETKEINPDDNYIDSFWLKAGVGSDFSLTDKVYLRLSVLYGYLVYFGFNVPRDIYKFPHHSLTAKLALGYRF